MRTAFWIVYFWLATQAWAGEVVLKNGDRLTGRISRMEKSSVDFETDLLGKVVVPWNAIVKIQSDSPLYVAVTDDRVVFGKVSMRDGRLEIEPKNGDSLEYAKDAIRTMRSEDEQRAFMSRPPAKTPNSFDLWGGSLDAAISATRGNSDTETVNFGVRAARVSPHNKLSFYLMSILSDSAGGSRAPAFANTLRGGYRYEVNVSRRSFSFSFTDFEHDQFQGLSLRLVGGGGMGFNLVKNPKTSFQIFSGGSMNREHFRNGIQRHSREFVLGNDFVRQVNRNVSVTETLFMYPNLSDRGQYRVNLDSSIVTRLNNWLGWQVTVSNRYVSNPASNSKNNDLLLTTGIRFMHRPEAAQNVEARPEFRRR